MAATSVDTLGAEAHEVIPTTKTERIKGFMVRHATPLPSSNQKRGADFESFDALRSSLLHIW